MEPLPILLVLTLLVGGALATIWIPTTKAVQLAAATCTFQIFTVPVLGIYVSVSHLAALASWKTLLSSSLWRHTWFRALLVLLLWQLLASLWSPKPALAIRQVAYGLPFLVLAAGVASIASERPGTVHRAIAVALAMSAIAAVLVIAFRASPYLEARFLGWPGAQLFISRNQLDEIADGAYTVFDPAKAGGFFVNANVAAAYLGFCAIVAWHGALALGWKWLRWVAVLDLVAVLLTGSKAGMALAVLVPLVGLLVRAFRSSRLNPAVVIVGCVASALLLAWGAYVSDGILDSQFARASDDTLGSRFLVWEFAGHMFAIRPLQGLGFGGWEKLWPTYAAAHGLNPLFPPHNSVLILWAQSGLPAVAAALTFYGALTAAVVRAALDVSKTNESRQLAFGMALGLLWLFLQSLGENYGLVGEPHITPVMALIAGLLCSEVPASVAVTTNEA